MGLLALTSRNCEATITVAEVIDGEIDGEELQVMHCALHLGHGGPHEGHALWEEP